MVLVSLDPADLFLISMEVLIVLGLSVAFFFALKVRSQYPKLTSEGWMCICAGIVSILIHGIFDAIDTLKWDITGIEMNDWLNVFDGSFFVLGILLIGYGIYKTANYGAKIWGLN